MAATNTQRLAEFIINTRADDIPANVMDAARDALYEDRTYVTYTQSLGLPELREAVAKKLEFPIEKVAFNVQNYGNTSSATIPTCFDEYTQSGQIKRGQLVLMTTFGGGLTWGTTLVRL